MRLNIYNICIYVTIIIKVKGITYLRGDMGERVKRGYLEKLEGGKGGG